MGYSNSKILLTNDKIKIQLETLNHQEEAAEQENKYDVLLYTDASVDPSSNPPGNAAIGYIWYSKTKGEWAPITKQSAFIGHNHTSYSAEAIGITEALTHKPEEVMRNGGNTKIGIFTDSLSNLQNLGKGIITEMEQQELVSILQEQTATITFHHTKSHVGITRNEEVDSLCSITYQDPTRITLQRNGLITKSKVKNWVRQEMKKLRWKNLVARANIKNPHQTTSYFPEVLEGRIDVPKEHKHLPRHQAILISKARTNRWTQCNRFRARMRGNTAIGAPNCDLCKTEDNTKHVLDNCRRTQDLREAMLKKLSHKYNLVTKMLCTTIPKELKLLIGYLVAVEKLNADGYDGTEKCNPMA